MTVQGAGVYFQASGTGSKQCIRPHKHRSEETIFYKLTLWKSGGVSFIQDGRPNRKTIKIRGSLKKCGK